MRALQTATVLLLAAVSLSVCTRTASAQTTPVLLKDINTAGASADPYSITEVGGVAVFGANHATYGHELWRSDGTEAGTTLLKDVYAGPTDGFTGNILKVGSVVFFSGADATNGTELWKTDGTQAGTVLVKDINPGSVGSGPSMFAKVGTTLYFVATTASAGSELWKSDGTAAGTVIVRDLTPGAASTGIYNVAAVGSRVYFSVQVAAGASTYNDQLWKSDGTSAGTVLVKTFGPFTSFSGYIAYLTDVNGTLFFRGYDGSQYEVWKSDGTTGGTIILDINGSTSSYPWRFTNVNGTLFFVATDSAGGEELWKSNGTTAGTVRVKDILPGTGSSSPSSLYASGSTLYFTANDGTNGYELWKSDGSSGGTVMVANIAAVGGSSSPGEFCDVNGVLFFRAEDTATRGTELWKTDGTAAGTVLVRDIYASSNDSNPYDIVNVGGVAFFAATDWHNTQLWRSDGTSAGTQLVADIHNGSDASFPKMFAAGDGLTFFVATEREHGTQWWKTDGTAAGTVLASNIVNGSVNTNSPSLAYINGTLFFEGNTGSQGTELWKTDGTIGGTSMVKDIYAGSNSSSPFSLRNLNGTLFFDAQDGTSGFELWKSDGTAAGTSRVLDLNPGNVSSSPDWLTVIGNTLFFSATTGTTGVELWKTDGTAAGTVLVKDIRTGTASSSPYSLTNVNGTLFFGANDGVTGTELWKSDGTATGTVLVKDINPGTANSSPSGFVNVNGTVFFSATDGSSGVELWKSDGTAVGTVRVKDISPGSGASSPSNLTYVGGVLLFRATESTTGVELWRSDGTDAGTQLVKDINPGTPSGSPSNFADVNGTLYFNATDGVNGGELWRSDGTAAGTMLVADIRPGVNSSSSPQLLTYSNGKLFFAADDGTVGQEPWVLSVEIPNNPPVADAGTDQMVEAGSAAGSSVTLDGSASSDPDSDPLTFEWRDGANNIVGTSQTVTVTAPMGTTIYTLTVTDSRGAIDTDTIAVIVRDTTDPTISIASPTNTAYSLNQVVLASYTCADVVSGIGTCVGTVANGATLDTSTAGTRSFTVNATDNVGNPASASVNYTVAKATPAIIWPTPAAIIYGTALGNTQLNATANVAGTLSYTPSSGTTLDVGSAQILSVTFDPDDDANYDGASKTVSIDVLAASPTVVASLASYTYDTSAHAASGLAYGIGGAGDVLSPAVTFSYSGSGGTIYPVTSVPPSQAGSYTVTAHFAGNTRYTSADSAPVAFSIAKANQTITVTDAAPANLQYNLSFSVSATSSSGLPVDITASGGCSITSGGSGSAAIHMNSGTGVCSVQYNQSGGSNFNAAGEVASQTTALKAAQTITFAPPASPRVFGEVFGVSATSDAALSVTIGADGGCSIDGTNRVTMTSGTTACVLTASQSGDDNYGAAIDVVQTVSAAKRAQAITFEQPTSPRVFGAAFAVAAVSDATLTVTIGAAGGCSIDGSYMVTMTSGTTACVLTASEGGDDNYAPATDVVRTVDAQRKAQTITFVQPTSPRAYNDAFPVAAVSDASLPVTIGASGGCSIDTSNIVTMTSGTTACVLSASQSGNTDIAAATNVVRSVAAQKVSATVTFVAGTLTQAYDGSVKTVATSTAPGALSVDISFTGTPQNAGSYPVTATVNDPNYSGSASGTLVIGKASATVTLGSLSQTFNGSPHPATAATDASGSTSFTFTYDGAPAAPTNAGSYTVVGTLVNGNFEGSATGTLIVAKAAQAAVSVTAPASVTYGGTGAAEATGGNGAGVFEFASAGAGCALSGTTVSVLDASAGCQLTAIRKGDGNYLDSAPSGPFTVALQKAPQTIAFMAPLPKNYGDPDFAVSASASSGLAVAFTIVSGPATIAGNMVHLTGAGTVVVRAGQTGNNNYLAAPTVEQSFVVNNQITRTGFYEPVNSVVTYVNTVKGGSTVPLKFEVFVNGVEKTDIAGLQFTVAQMGCSNSIEDAVDFTTTGGTTLRYDTSTGQFIQNWQTPKTPGACYVVRMTTTGDGGALTALFKMK